MKSSDLHNFLQSPKNGVQFKRAIQPAIPEFHRGLAEHGRSLPVQIEDQGKNFDVTVENLKNLCSWFLAGTIDAVELEYAANLLELSDDFSYPKNIADELFILGTPDINGTLNHESVRNVLKRLSGAA